MGPGWITEAKAAASRLDGKELVETLLDHGHAWLEYESRDGSKRTFSTWQGQGLREDRELNHPKVVARSIDLTTDQERRLFEFNAHVMAKKEKAWSIEHPCSAYTVAAWRHATGERLHDRDVASRVVERAYTFVAAALGRSNPTGLAASIRQKNERSLEHEKNMTHEREHDR
jgi:hypothetical protein